MKKDLNKTKEQLYFELNDLRNKSKEREEMLEANNQQLRATEQHLRAVNQQLQVQTEELSRMATVVKDSNDAIAIWDLEGNIKAWNAGAKKMYGYSDKEAFKMNISELVPNEYKSEALNLINQLKEGKLVESLETKRKTKDGKILDIWLVVTKLVDDNGKLIGAASTERDITERNTFVKELAKKSQQLEANNQQLVASEQQLRAANQQLEANNQQLTASEQQLRAANQQRCANEQQLRAANQQLIASELELIKEKKFSESIVETANAIIVGLDKDHKIRIFNQGAENITGYTKAEVIGKDWFKIFPPKEILNGMNKVWKNSWGIKSHSYVNPILSKAGKEIIVSWQTTGIYESEDASEHLLISIGEDITERKQTELEITKLSKIVETTSQHIVLTKMDGTVVYVNKAYIEVSGYKESEVIGSSMFDFTAEEGMKILKEETIPQLLSSGHWRGEMFVRIKDGTKFPADLICSLIKNKDGEPDYFVAVFNDITERKQAEKELTKLSTAVTQSPSVIAITDTKGDLEYVNPKFTELTGYTYEEAKGQNPRILKSGEQPDEMYAELWETISSGKKWRGEFYNKRKNGELFWESASVSPIFDEHGIIINYIKVAEDISQHKRNEQIQNIIHNISNATNTSLNINEFIEFIRVELRTIIDTENFYITLYDDKTKTISLLFHPDQKDKLESFPQGKTLTNYVIKTKKTLLATKEVKDKLVQSGEIELLGKDSKIWLGVPLMIKKKVIGAFAMQSYTDEKAFDKTDMRVLEIISNQISISLERKKAEEDLKLALEKAQESDRLKSAFLSNMSHEIRTPMNGILGFTSLLKQPNLTGDEQSNYIEIIERSGNRMLNTVNDIIDISMIEAGQVKVVKTEVSVNKILNEQYAFFNSEAQSKGLVLIYKPTLSDKEATIVTDKHKLEGILINLIKNAIKFTKHGNISFGYSLIKEKDIKKLKFYVKDTGIGIPSDRIKAVFKRFEKADIEDVQVFEGSGLGLAISKSYVEMLGGNIQLSSKEGSGSTFTFTIPYVQQSTKYSGIENIEKEEQKSSLSDVSIIIAEDDETSQLFFKTIFKNKFRNIIYTTNGAEAIEAIKKHPETDIILMDLKMPGMNGYDATREIRKFNRNVIIIAQTAFGLSGDKEKALEAGCDDYITKPINEELLFEMIMLHLSKKSI